MAGEASEDDRCHIEVGGMWLGRLLKMLDAI